MHYEQEIPVIDAGEVLVVGGGPGGIAAAISAARNGARTTLVERFGYLGGNLTAGRSAPA
jgi:NADPH-dependent 2,4-dienoyl-CoA reductase/sulfur reductase-like enzyme